jgi:PEP-CTERM motif
MIVRNIFVAGAIALAFSFSAQAQIANPSFENTTGLTINSWTQTGNVGFVQAAFGKTVVNGSKMAYMVSQNSAITGITSTAQVSAATLATALGTNTAALNTAAGAGHSVTTGVSATGGSGIFQSFTATAGTSLVFQWTFLTTEDAVLNPTTSNNDMGFVSINGAVTSLGRLNELPADPNDTSANQYIPFTGGAVNGTNVESYLFESGSGTGTAAQRTTDYNTNAINNPALGFAPTRYKTFIVNFPTTQTINLGFGVINVQTGASTGSTPSALIIDNLFLGVIPEPGTLPLLTLGIAGAATLLRRRKMAK